LEEIQHVRTLRRVAIALAIAFVVVLLAGLVLPRTWHVERSIVIAAAPERISPFLSTPRHWQEWSVWTRELDPQVRFTYEGPESGVGARWSWLGPKMGNGRSEITFADPKRGIRVDEAIESAQVNAHGAILLEEAGAGTRVTWIDDGTLPPLLGGFFRAMVSELLARNFEAGLAKLKAVVEALPPLPPPPLPVPSTSFDAGTPEH
jgi:hypothetical protein